MKKMIVVALTLIATSAFAQHTPPSSDDIGARVPKIQMRHVKDGTLAVPVMIDMNGVFAGGVPVNVGGYLAVVTFDPSQVALVGVGGGTSTPFTNTPYFTDLARANASGQVKITAAQAENLPTPLLLHVASTQFRELVPGGAATIAVRLESVASILVSDGETGAVKQPRIMIEEASRAVRRQEE